jgi:hypothetical protein
MRKISVLIGVVLLFATAAAATDFSKMEVYAGYTFARINPHTNFIPSFNANGGTAQVVYNVNRWFGAVGDFGAVNKGDIGGVQDTTLVNFLAGPRVSMRHARWRVYGQVLWGGVYAASSVRVTGFPVANQPALPVFIDPNSPLSVRVSSNQTAFAMIAGGGVEVKLSKRIWFRPFEVDYFLTRLQNHVTGLDHNQNNVRATGGFNFTFGEK